MSLFKKNTRFFSYKTENFGDQNRLDIDQYVNVLSERNAIPESRRVWGMLCHVKNDLGVTQTYQLKYGFTDTNIQNNLNWDLLVSVGTSAFTGLVDVPSSYASQAGRIVRVNGTETGLEFNTLDYSDLTGTPSLATVATSGDYNDLINTPTIPTISGTTNRAAMFTTPSAIGDSTWAFSGNAIYPVTDGSNIGLTGTNRVGTIFMASTIDYAVNMIFAEAGSEKMRIAAGGNVGIGTSPISNSRLTVLATINENVAWFETNLANARIVVGSSIADYGYVIVADNTHATTFLRQKISLSNSSTSTYGVAIHAYNNTDVTIGGSVGTIATFKGNTGRVGIGVTSPDTTLHIGGEGKFDNSVGIGISPGSYRLNIFDSTDKNIKFHSNTIDVFTAGKSGAGIYGMAVGTDWGGVGFTQLAHFYKSSGNAQADLRTDGTTHYAQFDFKAGTGRGHIATFSQSYVDSFLQGATVFGSINSGGKIIIDASSFGSSDIWFGGYVGGTPLARITSAGNLGIGVSPDTTARVHIRGTDATSNNFALKVESVSGGANLLYVRNDNWIGNANTGTTDRYADWRGSGSTRNLGWVIGNTNTAGSMTSLQVEATASTGNTAIAVYGVANGVTSGSSYGVRGSGGTGNQSYGVQGVGGNASVSIGVQGTTNFGLGSYGVGVLGSANASSATVTYGVWGNNTSTANVNNYGGYFDSSGTNTGTNVGGYFRGVNGTNNYAVIADGGNSGFGITTPSATVTIQSAAFTNPLLIHSNLYANIMTVYNNGYIGYNTRTWSGTNTYYLGDGQSSGISVGNFLSVNSTTGASPFAVYGHYAQSGTFLAGTSTATMVYGYFVGSGNVTSGYGVGGRARGAVTNNYGGHFSCDSGAVNSYGVYGDAQAATTLNIGVYGTAHNGGTGSASTVRSGWFRSYNYQNNGTVYGAYISAENSAAATNGTIYGLRVDATTTNGTSTNYAIVTNGGSSGFNTLTPTAMVHVKGSVVSTDFAFKAESNAGTPLIYSRNDGLSVIGGATLFSGYQLTVGSGSGNANIYLNSQNSQYGRVGAANNFSSIAYSGANYSLATGGGYKVGVILGGKVNTWATSDEPTINSPHGPYVYNVYNGEHLMYSYWVGGDRYLHFGSLGQSDADLAYVYGGQVYSFSTKHFSVGKYNPTARFSIKNNSSGIQNTFYLNGTNTFLANGTYGFGLVYEGGTYQTNVDAVGTVPNIYIHNFDSPTLSSQTNAVTGTNVALLHLGVPTAGSNFTITNAYSMIASGKVKAAELHADNGFNGTGAYTNFTIVNGIITSAS